MSKKQNRRKAEKKRAKAEALAQKNANVASEQELCNRAKVFVEILPREADAQPAGRAQACVQQNLSSSITLSSNAVFEDDLSGWDRLFVEVLSQGTEAPPAKGAEAHAQQNSTLSTSFSNDLFQWELSKQDHFFVNGLSVGVEERPASNNYASPGVIGQSRTYGISEIDGLHPFVQDEIKKHTLRPSSCLVERSQSQSKRQVPLGPKEIWSVDQDYLSLANVLEYQFAKYFDETETAVAPIVGFVQWLLRWPMLHGPARHKIQEDDTDATLYSKIAVVTTRPECNATAYCSNLFKAVGYEPIFLNSTTVLGANCIRRLIEVGNVFRWRQLVALDVDDLLNIIAYPRIVDAVQAVAHANLPVVFVCNNRKLYLDANMGRNVYRVRLPMGRLDMVNMFIDNMVSLSYTYYRQETRRRTSFRPRQFICTAWAVTTCHPAEQNRLPMMTGDCVFVMDMGVDADAVWKGWCMGVFGAFPRNNVVLDRSIRNKSH